MAPKSNTPAEPRRPYHEHPAFDLAGARVEPSLNRITQAGHTTSIEPKIMHVLVCLAEAEGEAVTKAELGRLVWDDAIVSDKVLPRAISVLRRALGDSPRKQMVIRTISKVGYQLVTLPEYANAAPRPGVRAERPARFTAPGQPRLQLGLFAGLMAALGALTAYALLSPPSRAAREVPSHPVLAAAGPSALLTSAAGHELYPEPGPEPGSVLYSADTEGSWDLYLLDAAGQSTRLTSGPGRELRPVLAPHGGELAYFDLDGTTGRLVRSNLRQTESGWELFGEQEVATFAVAPAGGSADWAMPGLSWSPNGHWLATSAIDPDARTFAVYKFETTTGFRQRVTSPPAGQADLDVDFSPDGRWLVVTRFVSISTAELHLVDAETSEIRPLTRDHRSILGHDWLPDSSGVVFSSNRAGRFALWHVPLDGSAPQWIPADGWNLKQPRFDRNGRLLYESWLYDTNVWTAALEGETPPRRLIESTHWDHDATLSPDGERLAFVSARSGSFEVWLANADGTDQARATDLGAAYVSAPRWSPDGAAITFAAHVRGETTIQVHEVASKHTSRVPGLEDHVANPVFTPDGQRLIHARRGDTHWDLWSVARDGTAPARLTTEGGYLALPTPAGSIYFTRIDKPGLWRLRAAGASPEMIHSAPAPGDSAAWSPTPDGLLVLERDPQTGTASIVEILGDGATQRTIRHDELDAAPDAGALTLWTGAGMASVIYTRIDATQADLHARPSPSQR